MNVRAPMWWCRPMCCSNPIPLGFGCCRNGNTKIAIMFVFHVAPGNAEGRRPRPNEVER